MNSVLTLNKTLHVEKKLNELDLNVNELVETASSVIVPLGPITAFAARHPWAGMEHQTFEKTARFLKNIGDVDIYPNESLIKSGLEHGEIKEEFLEIGLEKWLDDQNLALSRDVAKEYCLAALRGDKPSTESISIAELKNWAMKLNRFKPKMTEKHLVQTYSQLLENQERTTVAKVLNSHMIKWCKLYLDSQAVWSMPNRKEGFYSAWKGLVKHDPALKPTVRERLSNIPDEADRALEEVLLRLEIPFTDIQEYLEAHLLALPGWAGMMLWRTEQSDEDRTLLIEYLAVRLWLEWAIIKPYLPLQQQKQANQMTLEPLIAKWIQWGDMPIESWAQLSGTEIKARLTLAYRFDNILRNRLWLEAWEKTYEDDLKKLISSNVNHEAERKNQSALVQLAFCIDVRSEPFRRKLEASGPFATLGTAGFFGLPIETCKLGSEHRHPSLPVMFKPQMQVKEISREPELEPFQQRLGAVHASSSTFKGMKHHVLAGLMLPEISGPWLTFQTLARSIVPRRAGAAFRKVRENWLRKPAAELTLNIGQSDTELSIGFTEKEKVTYARQALKMMGLTENFAPLVVICGHGSHSTNNPYASSLDCGACGGASSEFNARVLAALCNLKEVRQALAMEGIIIPQDTIFIAAEHVTSTDELRFIYVPELSEKAREAFEQIQTVLPKVREEVSAERLMQLPNIGYKGEHPTLEAERFAEDWSEVRPEWGLARNAAFIIGKRELTKECQLEGRAFLHNYNWQKDNNGTILANIIKGPATVTQWINLQYYASTVAPHYYGSGNKRTQTVTSGIGVMQGNSSDLLPGLPWQSVMTSDHELYHIPLRLLVVIQAPKEYIEKLLKQDHTFHQKVYNGWIRLASIDDDGNWVSWS
ncbi:putative inorganic carbon transporter subunit DabA [Niallia oryzisoli]|uniref:Probable inorganic carbon transporter subunit DabA n=1 Tax=Niallia oryzisoli TaxID=1737571 RepID=A0ABZ2C8C3_9BACI